MNQPKISRDISLAAPRKWQRFIATVVLAVPWLAQVVNGQESAPPIRPPAAAADDTESRKSPDTSLQPLAAPSGGRIQYVGPDTYILLDSAGHPQPMPGMTYEDFLAAWKKLNQPNTADNQPGFTIEAIQFTGRTHGQRAELKFDATVRLISDGPADIPLGLVGAILQGEPHFGRDMPSDDKTKAATGTIAKKNSDDDFLTYDPDHGGFVARLTGRAGEHRTISFGLIVPLQHDGGETTLPINCPRSLESQLSLTIDGAISEARATAGAVLLQEPTAGGETNIKVAGPAGLFRLTWQSTSKDSPVLTSLLNALGAIRVTIDGRGVRSDARLTVRSFGGAFDQFRVRLPAGAQLIQARPEASGRQDAKYRIRVEPDSAPSKNDKEVPRQIAVMELPEKQQGPVIVDLATEQSGSVEDHGQEVSLAGFEVLGAVRQFGDVALNVADDWQARWTIGSYVRQVDPNELDPSLQSISPTAAFQYDRQPWALNVRVTPRQLRVHVMPKFELECLPEESRLTVRLAYQVFGSRAFEFRVDLSGWEITGDPVESGGLVDQDRITVEREKELDRERCTLVLPLAQASSRRAEIAFSLRRPTTHDSSRLELSLPVPVADSVGTGELIVRTAPDIDLLPDLSNSTGISAAPVPPTAPSATSDSGAELHFRTLLPNAIFVADRVSRSRDVGTQSKTQIDVAQDMAQIDQRIEYTVRYEPITELVFEVPDDLLPEAESFDLQLLTANPINDTKSDEQGTPLHLNPIDDEYATPSQLGTQQLRVMLPQPHIGRFAVRIRYRRPQPRAGTADSEWRIPLVLPADGKLASHQVTVRAPRSLAVGLSSSSDETSWKSASSPGESSTLNSANSFVADSPELHLPLTLRAGRSDSTTTTIVDRVWLQTWLSNDVQQDRAAFRFRTSGSQTTIELPPDALTAEFELLVDRQPADVLSRTPGRIVVRVPQPAASSTDGANSIVTSHTLELRYRPPYRHSLLTRHRLTPPQIEGSTALSQVYWHIVLPGDEHIVYSPEQFASASQWQWLATFWGRQPLKSQQQLEDWVGASEQPAPAEAQNQYLFTGLLPVASIELVTGPRWLIVLAASAAVLALVTAWLYVPVARRNWILAISVGLIAAAAIAYPTAALLLAQASAIGLVFAILSAVLSRIFARPARMPIAPVVSPSSQRMVTPRTDSIMMSPVISAASTAPTASLRLSDSER